MCICCLFGMFWVLFFFFDFATSRVREIYFAFFFLFSIFPLWSYYTRLKIAFTVNNFRFFFFFGRVTSFISLNQWLREQHCIDIQHLLRPSRKYNSHLCWNFFFFFSFQLIFLRSPIIVVYCFVTTYICRCYCYHCYIVQCAQKRA